MIKKEIKSFVLNLDMETYNSVKRASEIKGMSITGFIRYVLLKEVANRMGIINK